MKRIVLLLCLASCSSTIKEQLKRNNDRFEKCHERYSENSFDYTLSFIINKDGRHSNHKIINRRGLVNSEVRTCVFNILRAIRFDKPERGGSFKAEWPFSHYHR